MSNALITQKNLDFVLSGLTQKEKAYVEARLHGSIPVVAARVAGYSSPDDAVAKLETNEYVRLAIEYSIRRELHKAQYTRDDIVRGFEDAIRSAETAGEMISGYREIAKLQGLYEPEKRELTVKRETVERASDAELAKMAAIDGEFVELTDYDEELTDGDSLLPVGGDAGPDRGAPPRDAG